jgi:acetyl esterase/lipase
MPVGYLITTVFVACCTWCAVVPVRRPQALGRLSWMVGLVPSEMPSVVGFYVAAATLLAAASGDLDSTVGWTAFGIAVLAAAGIGIIVRRSLRTRTVVERALRDDLGVPLTPRRLPLLRILVAPFWVTDRDVERIRDVRYGDAGTQNLLDIYRGRSAPPAGRVLIHFHGGGYRGGNKNREARPLIYRLAGRGWLCVSANYRLSPATFPDHVEDARKVVAWLRAHGPEYGAEDGASVFLAGSSAGGHLALTTALTDQTIVGAISLYAYYGRTDDADSSTTPAAYLGAEAPPVFVAHGDNDSYVLVETARDFVAKARAASARPVVYAELPGAQHSFDLFHSVRFARVIDAIEDFATRVAARA